jgi:hypothetical protein
VEDSIVTKLDSCSAVRVFSKKLTSRPPAESGVLGVNQVERAGTVREPRGRKHGLAAVRKGVKVEIVAGRRIGRESIAGALVWEPRVEGCAGRRESSGVVINRLTRVSVLALARS